MNAPRSIDEIIRTEGGRVVATLWRMTGSLVAAEDAFADAVVEALRSWPATGIPERPGAWLTTVARRKALDTMRRERQRGDRESAAMAQLAQDLDDGSSLSYHTVRDDQLRLIFTCCHPALGTSAQVVLALRVLCGLTTAEIAQLFLVPEATMGKRITRAKAKLAEGRIGYRIPPDHELPARLTGVLSVVALVFTNGHHAPLGPAMVRIDLTDEGIRLARLLVDLMPDEPECLGLLALLESTRARQSTRLDEHGSPVLLRDADRSRWDHDAIGAAVVLVERALRLGRPGPYQVQAAISCLHGVAPDIASTDWAQIVELYDVLVRLQPSIPAQANRAVAVGECAGPAAGLAALEAIDGADDWHLYHAARGDLLVRVGRAEDAAAAFARALACPHNDVDGTFLERRRVAAQLPS